MMSVVVILVLLETVRFLIKDKSETLSSKYVGRNRHHKTIKYFVPDNTRGGIVLQISKNSPL